MQKVNFISRRLKDLFNGEIIAYDVARNPSFEQISRII
ncbi:putative transposase [Glaesserella parasuis H465]|nr:putative transposase [Glaesserella parasuis H465]